MASAKRDAIDADAEEQAEDAFSQALREERRANSLRRSGRDEAAAQSFLAAAERFKRAGTEARLSAEDEEQERLKRANQQQGRGQTQPSPPAAEKPPPLNLEVEKEAVIQTLRRYERACNNRDAAAIRSVYPGVPGELLRQLADARAFTLTIKSIGEIKFYTLSETRRPALAPVTLVYDAVNPSGQRNRVERAQTIELEKQRGSWIIADVR